VGYADDLSFDPSLAIIGMAPAPEVGAGVKRPSLFGLGFLCIFLSSVGARAATYYITIAGLGGEPDYEQRFAGLAGDLDKLLKGSGGDLHAYTLSGKDATRMRVNEVFATVAREAKADDDLVVILIGHGSFDGAEYKFNLSGPDISGSELASLCDKVAAKRQLVVNTTSASGGSVGALKKSGRAVITATKSGTEKNATVFARYWIEAMRDPAADVDKNESISALEAFQYAERKTTEFYESQKRLATEHPQFEDTGKSEPVRAPSSESNEGLLLSTLTLVRIGQAQRAAADPAKRDLLAKKESLEQKIDKLKYEKAAMAEDDYKNQLTAALVELARVQRELDK
jgi:hypothetical protein